MNKNEDYTKSKDWLRFRAKWLRENHAIDGYYICGICGRWCDAQYVTLDHIEPRTHENMFDPDNIQPAHGACNYRKGSQRWKPKVDKEMYEFLKLVANL